MRSYLTPALLFLELLKLIKNSFEGHTYYIQRKYHIIIMGTLCHFVMKGFFFVNCVMVA